MEPIRTTALIDNGFVKISQDDLQKRSILTEKLTRACKMGFFYLEIPQACRPLLADAVAFANSFYNQKDVRDFKDEKFSGFHDRSSFQVESVYFEKHYWSEKLPDPLFQLAKQIEAVALDMLKKSLEICRIPEEFWKKVSGGATESEGQVHFTFNHYSPKKGKVPGIDVHRDFGLITVLYINQKGLQARIDGEWKEVNPIENHFVINFGRTLETLVNESEQLTAAWHRVPSLQEERISFGIFMDHHNDSKIYSRQGDGSLVVHAEHYETYLRKNFNNVYPGGDI